MSAQPRENRLAKETSPYLLQHAHNPVDWYAWGEEAFAEARRRDVPIFLSVGYSTCYWCHVMERESFEDEATAKEMNEKFVCIKVDREERPDVDDIYMNAVQATTGHGGWPMSVFLEPRRLRPYFGGTYYPPEERYGMPSFKNVLGAMSGAWKEKRAEVEQQAAALAGVVEENLAKKAEARAVGREQVAQGVTALLRIHDRVWGGFGGGSNNGGPKFPQPVYLDFLLAFRGFAGDDETRQAVDAAVRLTLDRMAMGGMNDQVRGGFHRYSVDGRWVVPHFEKMLYDNGQLAETYARAARVYDDALYRRVVRRTLEYVLLEMTSPEGGFYSAQDAEVKGREGANYLWTREQMALVLGKEDGAWAAKAYGVDKGPNFKDPHHPEVAASNVLWMEERGEESWERLDAINARLYAARAKREQPRRDDKVLAAWNGMMIAGMAAGGAVLGEPRFVEAARRAAEFVLTKMRDGEGLMRSWREGKARVPAFLEDYACVIHGLIELHRAGDDEDGRYLNAAVALSAEVERRFGDAKTGAYFDTLEGQSDLFVRARSTYDGALPAGVSVMLLNLIDLFEVRGDGAHLERGAACMAGLSSAVADSPVASVNSTRGLLRLLTSERGGRAVAAAGHGGPAGQAVALGTAAVGVGLVFAWVERVAGGEGVDGAAGLMLQVRIAERYHVNAADPGPGGAELIGLRVSVINGDGVVAHAEYPPGEVFGEKGDVRVYRGNVQVPVVLERTGAWAGRPLLAVRYQACTQTECLAPATVELDVAIDRK